MKGISNKEFNKIVARVDRVFTWERRKFDITKTFGNKSAFFVNYDEDGNRTFVYLGKTSFGIYGSYSTVRNGRRIEYKKLLESFAEIRDFLERVELLG